MNEFLRAQELDPGHSFNPNPFYRRRQYDRAIEMDRNDISRHAFGSWAHVNLAYDYDAAGRHEEAALQWEEVMRMLGYAEMAQGMHRAFLQSGYKGAYRTLTDSLEAADNEAHLFQLFFPRLSTQCWERRTGLSLGWREDSASTMHPSQD